MPAALRTRGDVARLAAGLALLAVAAAATETDVNSPAALACMALCPVAPAVPAGMVSAVAGFLSGFFLVRASTPRSADFLLAESPGETKWGSLAAALLASFLALAFRACAVPCPILFATRFAWMFPALAATCFALRVPAEAPNAPASGASPRERALRRHAPDLLAALSLVPFAAFFASCGPSLLSLVALALVLGVWFPRLARLSVPLLLSAFFFSLLLPDSAFFAFGLLVRQRYCLRGASRRAGGD